jgi:hypothetical protein
MRNDTQHKNKVMFSDFLDVGQTITFFKITLSFFSFARLFGELELDTTRDFLAHSILSTVRFADPSFCQL